MTDPKTTLLLVAGFFAYWWAVLIILGRMAPELRHGFVGVPYRVVRFAVRLFRRR